MMCYSFSQSPHVHCTAHRLIPGANNIYLDYYSIHRDPQYFLPEPDHFWPDGGYLQKTGALWRILLNLGARMRLLSTTSMPTFRSLTEHESVPGRLWSMVQKFDTEMAGWYYAEQHLPDCYVFNTGPLPVRLISRALSFLGSFVY